MAKPIGHAFSDELGIGRVDDEELRAVLSSVLPRQAQFRPGEVELRTDADETALFLRSKDSRLTEAVTGPAMTADLEQKLAATVHEGLLVEDISWVVHRWVMFAGRPMKGAYRHRDELQLGPVPDSAPLPGILTADHPFIVEFRVRSSPVHEVRLLRMRRRGREIELLLNLLMYRGVEWADRRTGKVWVRAEPPSEVIYRSMGYFIPDFQVKADEFSDISSVATLPRVADEQYYGRKWPDYELALSGSFGDLLDIYAGLTPPDQQRFLRACHWLQTARLVWDTAKSLFLVALVQAIEAMTSDVARPDDLCGDGPTKLFTDFMKTYAPGRPSNQTLDAIYETRSQLTHGSLLLDYDLPTAFGLSEAYAQDSNVVRDAGILCRGALINWLAMQGARAKPLLAVGVTRSKPRKPGTKSGLVIRSS
jgi:hypothetical protein